MKVSHMVRGKSSKVAGTLIRPHDGQTDELVGTDKHSDTKRNTQGSINRSETGRYMERSEPCAQARGQGSHTHPPCFPAWATHASSRELQAQTGSWARMHSEQLWRRPQLVVFTCVTSVRDPTRSQL